MGKQETRAKVGLKKSIRESHSSHVYIDVRDAVLHDVVGVVRRGSARNELLWVLTLVQDFRL